MSARGPRASQERTSGFSLFEMVVALAIFAVAAMLGTQALNTTFWMERALTERQSELEKINTTLTLIRRDLRNAVMVKPVPGPGGLAELHLLVADTPLLFSQTQDTLIVETQPVIWQHRSADGELGRAITTASGELAFATLLEDVERLELETVSAEAGAVALIKFHIDVRGHGRLTVVEHVM